MDRTPFQRIISAPVDSPAKSNQFNAIFIRVAHPLRRAAKRDAASNQAARAGKYVSSRTRLENFQWHTEPFRRRGTLTESANLNHRLLHQRFVHPGDAKANGRVGEERGLNRLGHSAAKFRDIENMPD